MLNSILMNIYENICMSSNICRGYYPISIKKNNVTEKINMSFNITPELLQKLLSRK